MTERMERGMRALKTTHPAWRAWTALAAAYLLVLQMLMVGLATPALTLESTGILCQGAANSDAEGPLAPAGGAAADCCILGCPMFGPTVAPPPGHVALDSARSWQEAVPHGQPLLIASGLGAPAAQARAPPSKG